LAAVHGVDSSDSDGEDLPRGRDYDYRIGTKETCRVESMRVFFHMSVHMSQLLRENEFNAMFVHQSPAFLIV
jgi:hypothetical protein